MTRYRIREIILKEPTKITKGESIFRVEKRILPFCYQSLGYYFNTKRSAEEFIEKIK